MAGWDEPTNLDLLSKSRALLYLGLIRATPCQKLQNLVLIHYSSPGFNVRNYSAPYFCLTYVLTASRRVPEFHDEKDYKKKGGPPRATGYENALRALGACTTKYEHPRELLALSGVGPTCVERSV